MKNLDELIEKYIEIKDDLVEYTDEHHDAMLWDIEGYWQEAHECYADNDTEYLDVLSLQLTIQVNAAKSLLKGISSLDYKYC